MGVKTYLLKMDEGLHKRFKTACTIIQVPMTKMIADLMGDFCGFESEDRKVEREIEKRIARFRGEDVD